MYGTRGARHSRVRDWGLARYLRSLSTRRPTTRKHGARASLPARGLNAGGCSAPGMSSIKEAVQGGLYRRDSYQGLSTAGLSTLEDLASGRPGAGGQGGAVLRTRVRDGVSERGECRFSALRRQGGHGPGGQVLDTRGSVQGEWPRPLHPMPGSPRPTPQMVPSRRFRAGWRRGIWSSGRAPTCRTHQDLAGEAPDWWQEQVQTSSATRDLSPGWREECCVSGAEPRRREGVGTSLTASPIR